MADHSTPLGKFEHQRQRAKVRGIAWELSFEQWWAIWERSGKWALRGRKVGEYVMARHGDAGPYSVANVSIKLASQNNSEAHANGCVPRQKSVPSVWRGQPVRGWTYREGHKNPYQVKYRSKYVGCFATQHEAEAAHAQLMTNEK